METRELKSHRITTPTEYTEALLGYKLVLSQLTGRMTTTGGVSYFK